MRSLLTEHPDVDAVFAASDSMAAAVLGVIMDLGPRVPDDIAVVGFDDSPVATSVRPALTTVRQPIVAMGREMASFLMRQIADPVGAPSRVIFPTGVLIVRDSSAARAVAATDGRAARPIPAPGAVTPASTPPGAGR